MVQSASENHNGDAMRKWGNYYSAPKMTKAGEFDKRKATPYTLSIKEDYGKDSSKDTNHLATLALFEAIGG